VRSAFPPAAVASFSVDLPSKALSSLTAPSQPSASPDGHTQSAVTSPWALFASLLAAPRSSAARFPQAACVVLVAAVGGRLANADAAPTDPVS
jgi:hypothetical protein